MADAYFGTSIAAVGSYLFVGAPGEASGRGRTHAFDSATGDYRFTVLNPLSSFRFGSAATAFGELTAVGATGLPGSVTFFEGENMVGQLVNPGLAEMPPDESDDFGSELASRGQWLAIGAPRTDGTAPARLFDDGLTEDDVESDSGRVYLVREDDLTSALIIDNPQLDNSVRNDAENDHFGSSLAWVSDHLLLVGAPGDATGGANSGIVYLFDVSRGTPELQFAFPVGLPGEQLGSAVAASGSLLMIGAPGSNRGGPPDTGSLLIYKAGIADIGSLKELTQLHWLSLSGQQIEDVTSLGGMTDLEYAYLHDNRIQDIEVLAGQRIINNGRLANWGNAGSQENPLWQFSFADVPSYPDGVPAYSELGSGWLGNVDRVSGAYEEDYRFLPRDAAADDAKAVWEFENLVRDTGDPTDRVEYQVYVTWPEHSSRSSQVMYRVYDGDQLILEVAHVNQRQAPGRGDYAGRPWRNLGRVTTTSGNVRVELTAVARDGSVAADAVRLVALQRPNWLGLTLDQNPLDNAAHERYLDRLSDEVLANAGAKGVPGQFSFTPNPHAPILEDVASFGTAATTFSIVVSATDADSDGPLTYTALVSTTSVHFNGTRYDANNQPIMDFSADADYHGTVGITLIVRDGPTLTVDKRGRTDEVTLDVSIDRGAIYGVKWNDENKDGMKQDGEFGVEGVRIFVDENGDGQYTDGERETWTDANGQYAFRDLTADTYFVAEDTPDNAFPDVPTSFAQWRLRSEGFDPLEDVGRRSNRAELGQRSADGRLASGGDHQRTRCSDRRPLRVPPRHRDGTMAAANPGHFGICLDENCHGRTRSHTQFRLDVPHCRRIEQHEIE